MKRGRPRQPRARYPSGQIRPEEPGISFAELKRAQATGKHPWTGTQLGILLYRGDISLEQYDTGRRIEAIYDAYRRAVGTNPNAASPGFELGRGQSPSYETEDQAAVAVAATSDYQYLTGLLSQLPGRIRPAIEDLCVNDRACPPGMLSAVKMSLDMLAPALGLKRRKKA